MNKLRYILGPLRVFDVVCRCGSITEAAKKLYVTPSAVSQQLKILENHLGVQLIEKNGRDIYINERFSVFSSQIEECFDLIENAVDNIKKETDNNSVRIRVVPSFAIKWLLPRISDFYSNHDDIEVSISTAFKKSQDLRLTDLEFVIHHGKGNWQGVSSEKLFDEEFVIVCSPDISKIINKEDDLKNIKLLHSMMRPNAWKTWFESLRIDDSNFNKNLYFSNFSLACQAAVDSIGVAIGPLRYVENDIKDGRLVIPLNHSVKSNNSFYISWKTERKETKSMLCFKEWLLKAAH